MSILSESYILSVNLFLHSPVVALLMQAKYPSARAFEQSLVAAMAVWLVLRLAIITI